LNTNRVTGKILISNGLSMARGSGHVLISSPGRNASRPRNPFQRLFALSPKPSLGTPGDSLLQQEPNSTDHQIVKDHTASAQFCGHAFGHWAQRSRLLRSGVRKKENPPLGKLKCREFPFWEQLGKDLSWPHLWENATAAVPEPTAGVPDLPTGLNRTLPLKCNVPTSFVPLFHSPVKLMPKPRV
jgi:hypothetical protein